MNVLEGILSDSKKHYLDAQKKIKQKLIKLARGSVKKRRIQGGNYYYLQQRINNKIVHKYLGKEKPGKLLEEIKQRRALKSELMKVKEALKMIERSQRKKV